MDKKIKVGLDQAQVDLILESCRSKIEAYDHLTTLTVRDDVIAVANGVADTCRSIVQVIEDAGRVDHADTRHPDQVKTEAREVHRMHHGREGQLIQIKRPHRWGLCFAIIDETKVFGCQAYVMVPNNTMGEPDQAFIRLNRDQYELLNVYVDVESRKVVDGIDVGG